MKKLFTLCLFTIFLISCKNDSQKREDLDESSVEISEELSIAEKIANANGMEKFKELNELNFTFNVKVNDTLRAERSWKWFPKTKKVELTEKGETLSYTQGDSLTEKALAADQKFVNDSYWLLFPYQLMWSDFESTYNEKGVSPISNEEMKMLTVSYKGKGGYSPDDSYHIFFGEDNMIKEWTYVSSTGRELTTTWEDYETFKGIPIAKMHKSADSSFQLYFTDIKFK
jgi:outer membrane lipoprotein-sorting protein